MENLDELKQKAGIVDLIGGYVKLKRDGANYKGLCPFHSEKNPFVYGIAAAWDIQMLRLW
jgi:DNA primase